MYKHYPYCAKPANLKRWQPLIHHKKPEARFMTVLLPVIESIYQSLRQTLRVCPLLSTKLSDAMLASHLRQDTVNVFLPMIIKCCVIEMHKLRINQSLKGETPEERFNDFIKQCAQEPMYQRLWETYPVLKKCVTTKAHDYILAMDDFFQRLNNDITEIETQLINAPVKRFKHFKASGDTHRQCRRVVIVSVITTFDQVRRFVYKPRSLSNEGYYADFCRWYNSVSQTPTLKFPNIMEYDSYGYCEFIEYTTCKQPKDINTFYHSLGEISALLLIINGLDIHYENLIAHGAHPILIDMECIMSPVIKAHQYNYPNVGQSLILPRQFNATRKNKGVDLSGISDNDDQKLWRKVPRWHKPGTDEMHLIREDSTLKTHGNAPRLNRQPVKPISQYADDYELGFKTAYQILMQHRQALLSENSPLFNNQTVVTRYLFRNTNDYAFLLNESYHPLLLNDKKKYSDHIQWLNEIIAYRPYYKNIVLSEKKDLDRGDIPYFESRANETMVYDSDLEPVPCSIVRSGEQQSRQLLNHLSEEDLSTQCQLIQFSFIAHRWNKLDITEIKGMHYKEDGTQNLKCQDIIEQLNKGATITEGQISWPQLSIDEHQSWVSDLTGYSFYDGIMGVAFTLAHWHHFYSCDNCRELTDKILESIKHHLDQHPAIGFGLNGFAGMLYAAHQIKQCGFNQAQSIVDVLIKNNNATPNHHDEVFDLMGGISLDITTLLHLIDHYDIEENIIHEKIDFLKQQCPDPRAFSHDDDSQFEDGTPHPPLLSYAHGIAGVAICFSRYAKQFNDEFSKQWVYQTFELLDRYYHPDKQYWPDMRCCSDFKVLSDVVSQPPAWCGGHVGIGLFYIECIEQWPELKELALDRLQKAVYITKKTAQSNHQVPNLCCGFYGDLDLLVEINNRLPNVLPTATDPIIQTFLNKLPTCQFDANFVSLFRGMPSFLYCHMRAHHAKDMPSAIFW